MDTEAIVLGSLLWELGLGWRTLQQLVNLEFRYLTFPVLCIVGDLGSSAVKGSGVSETGSPCPVLPRRPTPSKTARTPLGGKA